VAAPPWGVVSVPERRVVELADLRGAWVVLYFFPKAITAGCTTQACAIREALPALPGFRVYGCSPDHPDSLAAFRQSFGLPFSLLSDPDLAMARRYRVVDGLLTPRIERTTFLLDPEGRVARMSRRVFPERSGEELRAWAT
jgi:peroxiredoxin Q/BCP